MLFAQPINIDCQYPLTEEILRYTEYTNHSLGELYTQADRFFYPGDAKSFEYSSLKSKLENITNLPGTLCNSALEMLDKFYNIGIMPSLTYSTDESIIFEFKKGGYRHAVEIFEDTSVVFVKRGIENKYVDYSLSEENEIISNVIELMTNDHAG
jgi:hypothetical protein